MGISINSKLILGYTYADLQDWADADGNDVDELLDNGELDYASPYYDSPREEWVIGISVSPWGMDIEKHVQGLSSARLELLAEFGIEPRLYVSAHVT